MTVRCEFKECERWDGAREEDPSGEGGGSVKRERCWVNWRSWKEEGMRRNEGRDRWNTGKTFPKMVRAPVRASLSKYERRERRKKKRSSRCRSSSVFSTVPPVLLNKHPSVSADWCWFGWDYRDILTPVDFPEHSVGRQRICCCCCCSVCTHTFFTRQKKNHSCIFPNKYILKAFQKCCGCDPAVLTGGVVFRKKKTKRELHREITQRAAI